jgi:hypothetical protein
MDANGSASNSPGVGLALGWIFANTLAWVLVFVIPNSNWKFVASSSTRVLGPEIVGYGLLVATVQWMALRGRVRSAPVWIIGTCVAWVIGSWNLFVLDQTRQFLALCWVGTVGGTIAGLAQAWSLRGYSRAAYWIPATVLSSLAGWFVGVRVGFHVWFRLGFNQSLRNENLPAQAGALVLGIVSASISAPVLIWILRHPRLGLSGSHFLASRGSTPKLRT